MWINKYKYELEKKKYEYKIKELEDRIKELENKKYMCYNKKHKYEFAFYKLAGGTGHGDEQIIRYYKCSRCGKIIQM